jgi:DNA repair exonuclease SbcCD ATPase subunit
MKQDTGTTIGIYTDPQFYWRNNAYESGQNPAHVMDRVLRHIYAEAYGMGVRTMLMTGDFVHFPTPDNQTTNLVTKLVTELATLYPDLTTYWIVGNHDYKEGGKLGGKIDSETILEVLQKAAPDNWKGVENGSVQVAHNIRIHGIPFYRHEEHFFDMLGANEAHIMAEPFNGVEVLMMHQDERNQPPKTSLIDPESPTFDAWDYVFNGHIHKRAEYRNRTWIMAGIPACMMEGDHGDAPKGFYTLHVSKDYKRGDKAGRELKHHAVLKVGEWTVPQFKYYYTGDDVQPEDVGHFIYRSDKVGTEAERQAKVVDDTNAEGRNNIAVDFLKESVKQFNPEGEDAPAILAEMEKVIAKVPNLQMTAVAKLRFKELWGEGFRSWVNKFHFPLELDKLTYIQAPVGSGKSSLFELLVWLWYGTTTKEQGKVDEVVSRKALQGKADAWGGTAGGLVFEFEGRTFELVRSIKYTKQLHGFAPKSGLYCFLHEDGKATDLDYKFFNVDSTQFDTVTKRADVFVSYFLKGCDYKRFTNTIYFSSDTSRLITGKEAEVRNILEPMFNLEWIDEAKEVAKVEKDLLDKEAGKHNAQHDVHKDTVTREEGKLEGAKEKEVVDAAKAVEDLALVEGKITNNEGSLKTAEERLPSEKQAVEDARKAVDGIKGVNPHAAKAETLRTAYNALQDKVQEAKQVRNRFDPEKPDAKEVDAKKLVDDYAKKAGDHEQELVVLGRKKTQGEKDVTEAKGKWEKAEAARLDPNNLVCFNCSQDYPEGHDHLGALDKAVKDAEAVHVKAVQDLAEIVKAVETATASKQQAELDKQEAEGVHKFLKDGRDKRNVDAQAELDKAVTAAEDKAHASKTAWDTQKAKVTQWETDQAPATEAAQQVLEDAEQQVEATTKFIAQIGEVLRTQRTNAKALRERKPADLKPYEDAVAEAIRRKDESKAKADEYTAKAVIYNTLITKVFTTTGLKRTLMAKKLDQINQFATRYITATGTLISYEMDESGKWSCVVNVNGEQVPASTLSTGQANLANLMLVHCLSDLQRQTLDINLMVLDEPLSNMNLEYAVQTSRMLREGVGPDFTKIVITHVQPLDTTGADVISIRGSNVEPSRLVM